MSSTHSPTPEQQRLAIALACGYSKSKVWRWGPDGKRQDYWNHPSGEIQRRTTHLPFFITSLEAMHRAEMDIIYKDGPESDLAFDYLANLVLTADAGLSQSATAPQRAEAFLRAIGKWDEIAHATSEEAQP